MLTKSDYTRMTRWGSLSSDGLHFARSSSNPVVSNPSASIGNVSALSEDGKIYLFYTYRVNDGAKASESLGETVLKT